MLTSIYKLIYVKKWMSYQKELQVQINQFYSKKP